MWIITKTVIILCDYVLSEKQLSVCITSLIMQTLSMWHVCNSHVSSFFSAVCVDLKLRLSSSFRVLKSCMHFNILCSPMCAIQITAIDFILLLTELRLVGYTSHMTQIWQWKHNCRWLQWEAGKTVKKGLCVCAVFPYPLQIHKVTCSQDNTFLVSRFSKLFPLN